MIVKLLTEHHLEFLSLKGGCTGLSESTLVKMSNCWKSRALAQMIITLDKYSGYMFMSSPNCMMSSSVAMEILCFTNIGSISSKKIAGVEKLL